MGAKTPPYLWSLGRTLSRDSSVWGSSGLGLGGDQG